MQIPSFHENYYNHAFIEAGKMCVGPKALLYGIQTQSMLKSKVLPHRTISQDIRRLRVFQADVVSG